MKDLTISKLNLPKMFDGYLNYKLNDNNLRLGQFQRPSIDMFNNGDQYKPWEWYNDGFIEGDFGSINLIMAYN